MKSMMPTSAQRATLELLKMYSEMTLTNVRMNVEERTEAFRALVMQLEACVAGEKQEPYKYETVANWWEHLKLRWFPGWLTKRFPVRLKEHVVDLKTVYPFLKTQLPREVLGSLVTVFVNNRPAGSFLNETDGMTPQEWNSGPRLDLLLRQQPHDGICPTCHRGIFFKHGEWVR